MGLTGSKFFKSDPPKSEKKEKVFINDPRSPTGEINRTPIAVDKVKPYLETNLDDILSEPVRDNMRRKAIPLRTKLLRSLRIDPRSPTVGIDRTPIMVSNSPVSQNSGSQNCGSQPSQPFWDSPVSVYSSNFLEIDSIIDMTAPPDPSVNVSDFDISVESFSEKIDDLADQLSLNNLIADSVDTTQEEIENIEEEEEDGVSSIVALLSPPTEENSLENVVNVETPLKVIDVPSTAEAKKLFKELCEVESLDSSMSMDDQFPTNNPVTPLKKSLIKKSRIPRKESKSLSLSCFDEEKLSLKSRAPLSNITSSANSPGQLTSLKKSLKRTKILLDPGLENSPSPCQEKQGRRRAEWDQDNTVII